LKAINRSTANFNVDGSTLAGDVNVEAGSTVALLMQNGATLNGNLQNVTRSGFDTGATLNGNVEAVAGTAPLSVWTMAQPSTVTSTMSSACR
jgi:hypothetical protein